MRIHTHIHIQKCMYTYEYRYMYIYIYMDLRIHTLRIYISEIYMRISPNTFAVRFLLSVLCSFVQWLQCVFWPFGPLRTRKVLVRGLMQGPMLLRFLFEGVCKQKLSPAIHAVRADDKGPARGRCVMC